MQITILQYKSVLNILGNIDKCALYLLQTL